jgi:D-lactate dehydrogenase (cytochrome)
LPCNSSLGYGKKKFLEKQYGAAGVSLMQTIKSSIDPWSIMNPDKIVDVDLGLKTIV